MNISAARIYRNIPFIWSLTGLLSCLFMFIKINSGDSSYAQQIINIYNFLKSSGLLLIGVPAICLLVWPKADQKLNHWEKYSFATQILSGLSFIGYVFFANHGQYFGFEQVPSQLSTLWSVGFLLCVLAGITSVFAGLSRKSKDPSHFAHRVTTLFMFASLGLAAGICFLQIIFTNIDVNSNYYAVMIPLTKILERFLWLSAISAVIGKIDTSRIQFLSSPRNIVLCISSVACLVSINTGDFYSSSNALYLLTKFILGLGITGFVTLALINSFNTIQARGMSFITTFTWLPFFSLILLLVSQLFLIGIPTSSSMSTGIFHQMQTVITTILIPVLFLYSFDHQPTKQSTAAQFSGVLIWMGLVTTTFTMFALSPYGVSMSEILNPVFKGYFGFIMMGLATTILGFLTWIWNMVLNELI